MSLLASPAAAGQAARLAAGPSHAAIAQAVGAAPGAPGMPATGTLLGQPSSGPLSSGVPDIGLGGYAFNLGLVLVALVGLAYLAARLGRGRFGLPIPLGLKARDLRLEDRLPIDPQRSIVVVGHGRRRFLVGMTPYSINTLAELDKAPDFEQSLQQEVRG